MLKIFLISLDVIIHLSCSLAAFMQKNSQKMFFLIFMTIIRIEKKKAYLSLPVLAACTQVGGVNCLFVLTIQTQIPTEFPIIDQIDEKKFLSIQKNAFFPLCSPGHSRSQRVYNPLILDCENHVFYHFLPETEILGEG